jgi:tRNA dimethylallyltransferase
MPPSSSAASSGASTRLRVLALVGPTGTGKTELAAELARRAAGEVISADSMQVYRGMDIGTAKPSAALRAEIPHHGLDLVNPDEPMSAGRFAAHARAVAADIGARGRAVVLCGGTGLYARAFARGLVAGVESDPALRRELEARSTEDLRAELARVDPESARRIGARDRVRIVRALEAGRLAGCPLSLQHARHRFADTPFDVRFLAVDLARDVHAERLRARTEAMFDAGLVEEVRGLEAAGYGPELRPLRSIGYREAGALLRGELGAEAAREATFIATRRLAKRQRTWFRAEPGLRWIDAANPEQVVEAAQRELFE